MANRSNSWIAGSGSPCVLTIRELRISLPHVTPRPFKRLRGTDIRGRKLNALDAKIEQGKRGRLPSVPKLFGRV